MTARPRARSVVPPPAAALALALLLAVTGSARANSVHEVQQVGLSFDPDELTVEPGDTVRWIWSTGSHTVTSGTPCTSDGLYFDEPLNAANPVVEWIVPDIEGGVPYFCMPHCEFEMTGLIFVFERCIGDIDGCGTVDVNDLIIVLANWGKCPVKGDCRADVDDSGMVDTADLLIVLANWGPCL